MNNGNLNRRELVVKLISRCGNAAVVTGLGSPTYDVAAAGDRAENFYLWGAMGGAAMVGLGIALGQPGRRVLVITGDGEALMGVGSFSAIAAQNPANLAILILDNEMFCETGNQAGLTSKGTDLAEIAKASGISNTFTARGPMDQERLLDLLLTSEGPMVGVAKIQRMELPRVLPTRDGVYLQHRFRSALGLSDGVS